MKFVYSGPTSGVTLQTDDGPKEVMLHTGAEVELPEENEYVNTLAALKHLTAVVEDARAKPAKATGISDKKGA